MNIIKYDDLKKGCEYIMKNAKEKKYVEIDGSYYGTIYILDNDACINGQAYYHLAKRYEKNRYVIYAMFNKLQLKILNPGLLMSCNKDSCTFENKGIPVDTSFYGVRPKKLIEITAGFCHKIDNQIVCYSSNGIAIETL